MSKKHSIFIILVCEKIRNGKKRGFLNHFYRFLITYGLYRLICSVLRVKNLKNHRLILVAWVIKWKKNCFKTKKQIKELKHTNHSKIWPIHILSRVFAITSSTSLRTSNAYLYFQLPLKKYLQLPLFGQYFISSCTWLDLLLNNFLEVLKYYSIIISFS